MHRRIINKVLEDLDSERGGYFLDVVARIEKDPRTELLSNSVYVLLKETMPLLPTYLDQREFIDFLFDFLTANHLMMEKKMFSKDYIYDQSVVKAVTNDFVSKVVDLTLQHYENDDIDTGEKVARKFSWPYRAEDLVDPDDEEVSEDLPEEPQNRPPYAGPERRKR